MSPAEIEAKHRRQFERMLDRKLWPYAYPVRMIMSARDAERALLIKMEGEGKVVRARQRVDKHGEANRRGQSWREVWVRPGRLEELVAAGTVVRAS